MDSLSFLRDTRPAAPRGFTLVEMLVVLSIVVIITVIAITGQGTFNRSLILTDTAYTVAFSIREAQTLGLSSRVFTNAANVSTTNAGYGIRFDRTTPTAYVQFSDVYPVAPGSTQGGQCPGHTSPQGTPDARPGNCLYDPTQGELVRTYALNRGFTISSFCGTSASGTTQICSGTQIDTLDIVFMRPSTNAVIFGKSSSGTVYPLSNAVIHLRSPDNASERCITVTKVGQISVVTCP